MKQKNTFLNDIVNWVFFAILVCVVVIWAIVAAISIIIAVCCFMFAVVIFLPFTKKNEDMRTDKVYT